MNGSTGSAEGALRIERRGSLAIWTIDRPQAKNALDFATIDAIAHQCTNEEADIRVVILTGAEDAFAAGGDLRELQAVVTAADARAFAARGARMCRAIAEMPVPVIAAVHGAAYGGGAELAVACDLRVVDATSRIGFRQARMGVTTAWGTLSPLVALVGAGAATRLLFTTDDVEAVEALRIGLADAHGATAMEGALALARAMEKASPDAIAAQKSILRRETDKWTPGTSEPTAAEDADLSAFVRTWTGADHAEAMNAFFARRGPKFR